MRVTHKFAALALLLIGTVTCSDPDTVPGPGTPSTATSILITDTPFPYDLVERADLFIVRVTVGTDSGSTGSACTGALEVAAPNRIINLLELQHGTTALLDTITLAAGDYGAVCVTINTDLSSLTLKDGRILTGTSSPGIDWSGAGERILKSDVPDPIAIADSGGNILIHFDVGRSFIPLQDVEPPRSDSGFAFIATVEAFDPSRTGAISGRLVAISAAGAPIVNASIRALVGDSSMAEGTWFVAGTGTTDAAGNFTLAYMSPSSRWAGAGWVYMLAADAPTALGLGPVRVKGVDVTMGSTTELGVLVALEAAP